MKKLIFFLCLSLSAQTSTKVRLGTHTQGTLPANQGGTGITTLSANQVIFGATSTTYGQDSTFVWNNSSKKLQVTGTLTISKSGAVVTEDGRINLNDDITSWSTFTGINDGARFVFNDYAKSSENAGGTLPIVQALVGAVKGPATTSASSVLIGLGGYASTQNTTSQAVGVFAYGQARANSAKGYGLNAAASDLAGLTTGTIIYGAEIDVNVYSASTSALGIWLNGGGAAGVTPVASESIRVGYVHDDAVAANRIPWNYGFNILDGGATIGLGLGIQGTGNNRFSQPIYGRGISSGGTVTTGAIRWNPDGALELLSGKADVATAVVGARILAPQDYLQVPVALQVGSSGGIIKAIYSNQVVWDPPSLADGASTSTTMTVTGCDVESPISVSHSALSSQVMILSGHVQSTDTVRVVLLNRNGGTVDVVSGNLRAQCFRYN